MSGIIMLSPLIEGALDLRRQSLRARRRAAIAVAGRGRARAQRRVQQRGAGGGRAFCAHRVSDDARRSAAEGRSGARLLCAGRPDHRAAGGRGRKSRGFIRDAYVKNLRSGEGKIVSRYDATFAVADPFPEQETARGPDPLLDGLTRAYGAPSRPMRATSSASRPR